jgi:UDP-glucuronate decarboxylase
LGPRQPNRAALLLRRRQALRRDAIFRLLATAQARHQSGAHLQYLRAAHAHPNDGRVVSNFIVQALLGRDITVFGDGLQTRSFCYVDDLIDGLMRLMKTPNEMIGPINLGNPKEFTILELASLVVELTGSRSRIVHRSRPQDDPRQRRPDISKANDILGWAPKMQLKEGLSRTIGYFETLLSDGTVKASIARDQSAET